MAYLDGLPGDLDVAGLHELAEAEGEVALGQEGLARLDHVDVALDGVCTHTAVSAQVERHKAC